MKTTTEKLAALRQQMKQHGLDFYLVPSADAHNNEYVPSCWERRAFISGFDGSAGDILVGLDAAYLWTDPRYFLQASEQIDAQHIQIMRQQQGMAAPIHEWFRDHAANKVVGIDPKLLPASTARQWKKALESVGGTLKSIETNLVDNIWENRPKLARKPIFLWPEKHAGQSARDKVSAVQNAIKKHPADAYVTNLLDAIAWLYNFRGDDNAFNPLAISYGLITREDAFLFIDPQQVPETCRAYFNAQGITLKPYDDFAATLNQLTGTVLLEHGATSAFIAEQLTQADIAFAPSIINALKSIKNKTEQAGMREAHRMDAVAVCRFLHWLENNWQGQTEISVSDKLEALRRESPDCRGLSFSTIAGFADHGAIIHYFATPNTDKPINDQHLFLIDSGGQYWQGTTDITRTVHLGTPTATERRHYTLVLKAHLALRTTYFPKGTTGEQIHPIARREIWREKMSYGHGTGHGVGCYLCVHEGPQRISDAHTNIALKPGMIVSNEPGLYLEGQYGIRVENLCLINVVEDGPGATGHGPFYGFEDLTLVPHARKLIDISLLCADEITAINDYHHRVFEAIAPRVDNTVKTWLKAATAPLS